MTNRVESNPSDGEPPGGTDAVSPRSYDPAFVEDDANIVLRSSDGIHYRIPSYTLRTTSGFFRDMFTLPMPVSGTNQGEVIVMDETSKVLGKLLRMIGGLGFAKWESTEELEAVFAAAEKYDMPGPIATMAVNLTTSVFIQKPLKLYAVAARYGLEDVAKYASKLTLSLSIYDEEHIRVLERVPTTYVLRLFRLHRKRRDEFQKLVNLNKTLGVTTCLNCHVDLSGGALKGITYLAQVMVSKIDLHPIGSELLDGTWKTWPEAMERACTRAGFNCSYPVAHYYQETITTTITNFMKSLPDTI